jgi:hypothetical protein
MFAEKEYEKLLERMKAQESHEREPLVRTCLVSIIEALKGIVRAKKEAKNG